MELLPVEDRGTSGQDTELSIANGNGGARDTCLHQGNNAADKDRDPAAEVGALGVSPGGGNAGVSALDRIRAMANAGLRYTHPQPERDLRIGEESGGEDSGAGGREEVIDRKRERKKEVDMER